MNDLRQIVANVNVLIEDLPEDRWTDLVPAVREEIYRLTLFLGGTITAGSGTGATRRQYLPWALDQPQIDLMLRIRDRFDSHRILNTGKIIP